MKVIWDPNAKKGRRQIANYIHRQFGEKRKQRFLQEVSEATQMLKRYPSIGTIDPLFADRPETYRSIVINGLSKMVYLIKGDTLYIAALWDCRRDPEAEAGKTGLGH